MCVDPSSGSNHLARGHQVAGEPVEHVTPDDEVIEIVTRAQMRAENLRHRSVVIIVQSSGGELLVHRRADDKDVYPGWWDLAAGGVVGAGETYDDAAVREVAEELGLSGVVPEYVTCVRYEDDQAREICHVYRLVHDGPYRFDDGEVAEARLVDASGLARLVEHERVLPGSVAMLRPLIESLDGGFLTDPDHVRCRSVQRVEFTVEPFIEGQPGRHVTAPVEAVQARGIEVEFGPFGSECTAPSTDTPAIVASIVEAAFANGATHVTIDVTALPAPDGAAG